MTKEESLLILAQLTYAYPKQFKDIDEKTADGIATVWATQFINIPYFVVFIAVQKIISTREWSPSIAEVKKEVRGLYWEAWEMLNRHNNATKGIKFTNDPNEESWTYGEPLPPEKLAQVKEILKVCEPLRTVEAITPKLSDLIESYNGYLSNSADKTKRIE